MSVTLGALDLTGQGFVSLTVHPKDLSGNPIVIDPLASTTAPADPVGFIISRPAGTLATADVLAQASIQTTLGGQPAQSFSPSNGADTLTVDLLGAPLVPAGIPADMRFILFSGPITQKFDAITLRFAPAVASALAALDVFNVCSDVEVAPPAAQ
jgi:hypothetical protein